MKTKNLILSLIIIGAIVFLIVTNQPPVYNQRTNPSTNSTASAFTSRLETMTADEIIGNNDSNELQTITKLESSDSSSRKVASGDEITVHYRGWLAFDGSVFDQSFNRGNPFTFTVGQGVIEGWSQGVLGMQVGEVRRLKIPSELGYGEIGAGGSIPANADLIFDVELVSFN